MSRSYKKNPFCGHTTAESDKEDKKVAHKKDRRINKSILSNTHDDLQTKDRKSTSSPWDMAKDGKQRIDPAKHRKEMRK